MKNLKLSMIEEEIINLQSLVLNNKILTMNDNEFASIMNKFKAL